jgi:serine/threonine-protein kinase
VLGRSALPNPGDIIGAKYAITRVLGSGGMGVVFEAMHLRLRQRVAVKMLRPELALLGETVARFEREARAAAKLRTTYVARVLDVDSLDDGTPYMVMEFLEGRDLSAEIAARGSLPIGEAVDYLLQACDAMGEAHRQGTVHRDLKPSNLFLATGERGRVVKVLDFGISKVVEEGVAESVTSTFSVMGTALYMSPELVRSAKHVDARSDVWALSVILYEMLAGRSPFVGETATAIAAAIVADAPTPMRAYRHDVPSQLEAAIMQGLEKDRDRRFPDAAAFAAAIAPFASRPAAEPSLPSDAARSPARLPLLQATPAVQSARATITAWSRGGAPATRARRKMIASGFAIASLAITTAVLILWPSGTTSPQPASVPSSYSDFSTPAPSVSSPTAIEMEQARGSRVEASSSAEPPSLESPATSNAPSVIPTKRPTPTPSVPPTPARSPKSAPKPPALPAKNSTTDLPTDPG